MNPYLKQYQQTQVQTASPERILIMLYDGAIQYLNKASIAMDEKNIEKTHNNIIAAQRIITEFMSSLDMEIGGEIAQNLYRLYEYFNYRLVQANIQKNKAYLQEVLQHLKELKATWEEAIRIDARRRAQEEDSAEESSSVYSA